MSAADSSKLYIADAINNRIRVLNTVTNQVTTLAGNGIKRSQDGTGLAAAFNYPFGLAASPDGKTLFVAEYGSGKIRAINIGSKEVTTIATITGSGKKFRPAYIGLSPDGKTLYVSCNDGAASDKVVRKINVNTKEVTKLPGTYTQPFDITVNPDNKKLWVTDKGVSGSVNKIDIATNAKTVVKSSLNHPTQVCMSSDGSVMYLMTPFQIKKMTTGQVCT